MILTKERQASRRIRHLPGEPGIWVMICGDMMMFSIMFIVFLFYRRDDLELFQSSQSHLNQSFGLINTFFMLTSSWCVAMAVEAARARRIKSTVVLFRLGFACGLGFAIIKIAEYAQEISAGIVINTNDFYMYYYVFTGIHFLHVLIGMGVLAFMAQYATKGDFAPIKIGHFESGASFWHLVDLLWIALFALLYLLK
ncbi:MAG TPA: cytochrome c oxidase subunit 3 family protein [Steroidobacteraceae bacterium]|nr:cytochrome c oxidase subunit 3 family protein [Steroidobacteraceae bacterium]